MPRGPKFLWVSVLIYYLQSCNKLLYFQYNWEIRINKYITQRSNSLMQAIRSLAFIIDDHWWMIIIHQFIRMQEWVHVCASRIVTVSKRVQSNNIPWMRSWYMTTVFHEQGSRWTRLWDAISQSREILLVEATVKTDGVCIEDLLTEIAVEVGA